jgi:hypothetical protein
VCSDEVKLNLPDTILVQDTGRIIHDPNFKNVQSKVLIRGYMQTRYNRLFETNPDLQCEQCDKSWGGTGGFFFRRIRLIFYGDIHEKVFLYLQPDFASGGSNLAQVRDAYFDLGIDNKQEFRIRVGQSKVPFGFENLQSSQNRIPLDRHDGLNSAVSNERDIGFFAYYAPSHIRKRFRHLVSSGLKGSGDYGVLGLGLFNGQTANQPEANNTPHIVGRLTYPFMLNNGQFIEASVQGYSGEVVIKQNPTNSGMNNNFVETRFATSFILYPQPFGLQAEYNVGRGPEFIPELMRVQNMPLEGGYVLASYFLKVQKHLLIPFFRWHYYEGGKKHEIDATKHRVNEQEIGVEWQPHQNFELVMMYTFSDRTFENYDNPVNRQKGRLLRIQAQVNF